MAAADTQSIGGESFQGAARIVCSATSDHFLLFSETSNIAYDYQVTD